MEIKSSRKYSHKIACIDADYIPYMIAHVCRDDTLETNLEQTKVYINNLVKEINCNQYILFITGTDNFRYKVIKTYKKSREKIKHLTQQGYFAEIKDFIFKNYICFRADGAEADDAVATFVKNNP